jgi:hypothetical protein
MSPRDKWLLAGLAACVVFGLVALTAATLHSRIADRASRVQDAEDNLELVTTMQGQYAEAAKKVKANEEMLKQYQGQPVSAFIEKAAKENNVSDDLSAVTEQGSETVGNVKTTKYRVELKHVPYDPTRYGLKFIEYIETSGYPVRIDAVHFRTTFTNGSKMLDITLDLSAFALGST